MKNYLFNYVFWGFIIMAVFIVLKLVGLVE